MVSPPHSHLLNLLFLNCSSSSEDESAGEREDESAVETSGVPESNAQTGECHRNTHHVEGAIAHSFPSSFNFENGAVIPIKANTFIYPSFPRNHIFPSDEDVPTFFGGTARPPFSRSSLENVLTWPSYLFLS